MKAKPLKFDGEKTYTPCPPDEATHLRFVMPSRRGWEVGHMILPVQTKGTRRDTGNWSWNGDCEKPTLKPSILQTKPNLPDRCHVWINDGIVMFLNDCTHELKGRCVPLCDMEEDV